MRSSDVRDELQDGIESAPLPPTAPDGGLELEPAQPIEDPPPRLCEAGPCRNYHRFSVQMDAQNPMAERKDGKLVRHARVFHTTTSHYCYPDVGIETNLGSLPVLECNRWVPIKSLLTMTRTVRAQHERELAAWHDAREKEADELAAVLSPPVQDMKIRVVILPEIRGPNPTILFQTEPWVASFEVSVDGSWTVRQVFGEAWRLATAGGSLPDGMTLDERMIGIFDGQSVGVVSNLDATLEQLDVVDGAIVHITMKMKETV